MRIIGLTASEEMSFENVDRRWTDDGRTDVRRMPSYTIRSPMSLGELKRECIISLMYSNIGQTGPKTTELVAIEHLKIPLYTYNGENGVSILLVVYLLENYSKYFDYYTCTCWPSGERSLPFGLLVSHFKQSISRRYILKSAMIHLKMSRPFYPTFLFE